MQLFRFLLFTILIFSTRFTAQDKETDSINKDALPEYKTLVLVVKQQRVAEKIFLSGKINPA